MELRRCYNKTCFHRCKNSTKGKVPNWKHSCKKACRKNCTNSVDELAEFDAEPSDMTEEEQSLYGRRNKKYGHNKKGNKRISRKCFHKCKKELSHNTANNWKHMCHKICMKSSMKHNMHGRQNGHMNQHNQYQGHQ